MATFVHLADSRQVAKIRRTGIRITRAAGNRPAGVYCMPIVPDHHATFQWARELVRWNGRRLVQVRFRIPDSETVWIGHFAKEHREIEAREAVAAVLSGVWAGHEIVVPRRIAAREIMSFATAPSLVGWRYSPIAKGQRPRIRSGEFRARVVREGLERREQAERRALLHLTLDSALAEGDAVRARLVRLTLLRLDVPQAFDQDGALRPEYETSLTRY